jgi:hypothetical protein
MSADPNPRASQKDWNAQATLGAETQHEPELIRNPGETAIDQADFCNAKPDMSEC